MQLRVGLAFLALLGFVLAAAAALGPLGGVPHVTDEIAYTLQARLFAHGMRTGPPGDNASMLLYPFFTVSPRAFSPFPPGWPALLAIGEALGAGWLVNALLAAALPPLTWLLATEWTGRREAWAAAVVAALSPGIWVLSGSRMAHTSVLVALLVALVVVVRGRNRLPAWIAAAAAVAYVVLARPFDAALVGGPLLAAGVWRAPRAGKAALVALPGLAAALLLWDNAALTGSPWQFPMSDWYGQWPLSAARPGCNALGFGNDVGCYPTLGSLGHTPGKAISIAGDTARRLDHLLLGVPGGLLLVALGAWRVRRWEPLALLALPVLGYALYWSPGLAYGARFWHTAYLALPVLVGAGAAVVARRWAVPALGALAVAGGSAVAADLADRYWCVDGKLADLLDEQRITEGVVFLQGEGTRHMTWPALGVDDFVCDPMLESGDGLLLQDPSSWTGGLQIRHALPDDEQAREFVRRYHSGASAWVVEHDVESDRRRVRLLER